MTTDAPVPEDDPFIDWHSDARGIMDDYANDMAYRHIAGTQLELLRAAAGAPVTAAQLEACFVEHCRRAAAAGMSEHAFTAASFTGFLVARALIAPTEDGGYALTSIGRTFLDFVEERHLPDRPL
jgi:hypothetical protein